jgi:hypothetical protein
MLRHKWLALRLLCLFTVSLAVGIVGYGLVFPWPAGETSLTAFRDNPKLLVGTSYASSGWPGATTEHRSASYVIFPYSLRTFNIVVVSTGTGEAPVVEDEPLLLPYCVLYVLATYGVYALRKLAPWPWRREP